MGLDSAFGLRNGGFADHYAVLVAIHLEPFERVLDGFQQFRSSSDELGIGFDLGNGALRNRDAANLISVFTSSADKNAVIEPRSRRVCR